MKWTEEQWDAITKEGTNIIVSAGAGSGKTAVLSERVLRKVKEGVDIRNILILTFTNEAAGEMKNRIRKKLIEANLKEQVIYLDSAYITTFDAYALAVVKKYHYLLNISKNISIIDASIIDLEKKKILEQIFLELYEAKDRDFLELIGDFTNRDDKLIVDAILKINRFLDLKYDKTSYLESYLDEFYNDSYVDQLLDEYFSYVKGKADEIQDIVYSLEGMIEDKLYEKVYSAYSSVFSPKCYDDLYRASIGSVQFRGVSEEVIPFKNQLSDLKKEFILLTKYSKQELKEQLLSTKNYVKSIIKIILELDKRVWIKKKEKEAFEFGDIARMAIKIVSDNPKIQKELKNSYNEILIDEYQDTNDLQEMFISKLENNNVYMVGDIKQSIYRFRNANPKIFKDKYDAYQNNHGGVKIDLLKNFRSREEVLNNINEIFNLLMTDYSGGVNYQNNHAMVYGNLAYVNEGKNDYNNNLEILKYDNKDKEYSDVEIEAFTIVNDIINKVKNHYQVFDFDLKKKRDANYKDFCIILDRGTDMPIYKKIFEYYSVPMDVYLDSNLTNENDILIIKNIINLILCIKNQEFGVEMRYSFVSIARSFIGNMSDAEIFAMCSLNTFYESKIYKTCFNISKNLDSKTPNKVLNEIIQEFDFYRKLVRVGNINSAIFRLDYLLDLATSAEKLGFTILDFKNYLEEVIDNEDSSIRYKETRGLGKCVTIMNIHKSKGLEFPICYFAGFKRKFNLKELNDRFMFDSKYGILTPFYQEGIGTCFTKTLIKNRYFLEEISEKVRLFYVALTRSKEKMIMVLPEVSNPLKQKGQVETLTAQNFRSFYDFMSAIILNLNKYVVSINLDDIPKTHDYQFSKTVVKNEEISDLKIEFRENFNDSKILESKHASKVISSVLTQKEESTLEFGTHMHEMLEMTDFRDDKIKNKYVDNLKNNFDFQNANIYQELEFIFEDNDVSYHGIIDLMLEYDDHIKIIDYKLKNVEDEHYIKQLEVYYKYVKSVSDKDIKMYLYSIIDNKIKELEYLK